MKSCRNGRSLPIQGETGQFPVQEFNLSEPLRKAPVPPTLQQNRYKLIFSLAFG